MIKRSSKAVWPRRFESWQGQGCPGSGAFEGQYSFTSRFEEGTGTNPEELIAAAHAGCFSMALSADLSKAGFTVDEVKTEAVISMDKVDGGFKIISSKLITKAKVPGISEAEFMKFAEGAKANCPVSKALGAIDLELDATLVK